MVSQHAWLKCLRRYHKTIKDEVSSPLDPGNSSKSSQQAYQNCESAAPTKVADQTQESLSTVTRQMWRRPSIGHVCCRKNHEHSRTRYHNLVTLHREANGSTPHPDIELFSKFKQKVHRKCFNFNNNSRENMQMGKKQRWLEHGITNSSHNCTAALDSTEKCWKNK